LESANFAAICRREQSTTVGGTDFTLKSWGRFPNLPHLHTAWKVCSTIVVDPPGRTSVGVITIFNVSADAGSIGHGGVAGAGPKGSPGEKWTNIANGLSK
jgi:hypothetical protein